MPLKVSAGFVMLVIVLPVDYKVVKVESYIQVPKKFSTCFSDTSVERFVLKSSLKNTPCQTEC